MPLKPIIYGTLMGVAAGGFITLIVHPWQGIVLIALSAFFAACAAVIMGDL